MLKRTIEYLEKILTALELPFEYFLNPQKRIYIPYFITSLILAYYVFKKSRNHPSFWKYIFANKVWNSSSAYVDYKLFFFNSLVKVFLITPIFYLGYDLMFEVEYFLERNFGFFGSPISKTYSLLGYTLSIVLLNDLFSFLIHWLMHVNKTLWEFHKVHHSATVLNPISQYRLHPVELIINNIKYVIIFGTMTGLFEYLSAGAVQKVTYLGVNVFSLLFLSWGANLRHSHVQLKYFNFLERIFISPRQHQIHHSDNPKHFNKNMGSKLAIWDFMFGTLLRTNQTFKVRFGLSPKENTHYATLIGAITTPFKNIWNKLRQ